MSEHLSKRENTWTTLSENLEFENGWFSVKTYKTLNPSGQPTDYGLIHFKYRAIGIVPYEEGYIWMVGQSRFAIDRYSWEIPEGGCPVGEDPLDTAHRELEEETGIRADAISPLFEMHVSNSITDEWGQVFLATGLSHGANKLEDSEDISVAKIHVDELYQKVEAGEITDSLTVTAIYKIMLMKLLGEL